MIAVARLGDPYANPPLCTGEVRLQHTPARTCHAEAAARTVCPNIGNWAFRSHFWWSPQREHVSASLGHPPQA
jgi:hypothetical protein